MSGAETARLPVVQRRISGAEMALPHVFIRVAIYYTLHMHLFDIMTIHVFNRYYIFRSLN